jgi:hypothetical protein
VALRAAMSAVRALYPNPIDWAPFALFGAAGPLRGSSAAR